MLYRIGFSSTSAICVLCSLINSFNSLVNSSSSILSCSSLAFSPASFFALAAFSAASALTRLASASLIAASASSSAAATSSAAASASSASSLDIDLLVKFLIKKELNKSNFLGFSGDSIFASVAGAFLAAAAAAALAFLAFIPACISCASPFIICVGNSGFVLGLRAIDERLISGALSSGVSSINRFPSSIFSVSLFGSILTDSLGVKNFGSLTIFESVSIFIVMALSSAILLFILSSSFISWSPINVIYYIYNICMFLII